MQAHQPNTFDKMFGPFRKIRISKEFQIFSAYLALPIFLLQTLRKPKNQTSQHKAEKEIFSLE